MPDSPLFSIVIPTKGRPALLERALHSALAQRGATFEIIVADDGAGDGAALALAMGAAPITAFETGFSGQAAARNMAAARARGAFVACLDDDDWWASPDHLATLAAPLARGVDLAYAAGRIVREDEGGIEIPFTPQGDPESLRRDNLLLVSGIAYRRDLHARIGWFDETMAVYWDWDFYLRIATTGGSFAASDGEGVRISTRGGTASSAAQLGTRRAELDRLVARHGLTGIVLRNHESIAMDQQRAQVAGQDGA